MDVLSDKDVITNIYKHSDLCEIMTSFCRINKPFYNAYIQFKQTNPLPFDTLSKDYEDYLLLKMSWIFQKHVELHFMRGDEFIDIQVRSNLNCNNNYTSQTLFKNIEERLDILTY